MKKFTKFTIIQALMISFLLIFSVAYFVELENLLTIMLIGFFAILVIALMILSLIISIVFLFVKKPYSAGNVVPFFINILAVIIVLLIPLQSIRRDNNFYRQLDRRTEVVELILSGELQLSENCRAELPVRYEGLSVNSKVFVIVIDERVAIYFHETNGFLGSSNGFAYLTDIKDDADFKKIQQSCRFPDSETFVVKTDYENGWVYGISRR